MLLTEENLKKFEPGKVNEYFVQRIKFIFHKVKYVCQNLTNSEEREIFEKTLTLTENLLKDQSSENFNRFKEHEETFSELHYFIPEISEETWQIYAWFIDCVNCLNFENCDKFELDVRFIYVMYWFSGFFNYGPETTEKYEQKEKIFQEKLLDYFYNQQTLFKTLNLEKIDDPLTFARELVYKINSGEIEKRIGLRSLVYKHLKNFEEFEICKDYLKSHNFFT